jgi:hypothetical protein
VAPMTEQYGDVEHERAKGEPVRTTLDHEDTSSGPGSTCHDVPKSPSHRQATHASHELVGRAGERPQREGRFDGNRAIERAEAP